MTQVTKASRPPAPVDNKAKAVPTRSAQVAALGVSFVSGLSALVRSVKTYGVDHAVFEKPLSSMEKIVEQLLVAEGRVLLVGGHDAFYLNDQPLVMPATAQDAVRALLSELREREIGGISIHRATAAAELRNFLWIFGRDGQLLPDEVWHPRRLVGMRVLHTDKVEARPEADTMKRAVTRYARAVSFLNHYLKALQAGKPVSSAPGLRLVQDLVDFAREQRAQALGLTTLKSETEYLAYHQVNVCITSIVLGDELGLSRVELRELGYIGLLHDTGMAMIPESLSAKRGALSPSERAIIQQAPLFSVRDILVEGGLSRLALLRAVNVFKHKVDYGVRLSEGETSYEPVVVAKGDLSVYTKILAIADAFDALTSKRPFRDAYTPDVACLLMWTEMRQRFDPELLKVFMRVMALAPVKLLRRTRAG